MRPAVGEEEPARSGAGDEPEGGAEHPRRGRRAAGRGRDRRARDEPAEVHDREGAARQDPDGDSLSYLWSLVARPAGAPGPAPG